MYANGSVIVLPLPLELYGSNARRSLPLRRIDAVLSDAEAEEPLSKELSKVALDYLCDSFDYLHNPEYTLMIYVLTLQFCEQLTAQLPYMHICCMNATVPDISGCHLYFVAPAETDAKHVQVPATLVLEPTSLASGEVLEIEAGQAVPETCVTILNGAKQKVVRGYLRGEKVSYSVTQRLWLLPEGAGVRQRCLHCITVSS